MEAKLCGGPGLPYLVHLSSSKTGGKRSVSNLVNPRLISRKPKGWCLQVINSTDWRQNRSNSVVGILCSCRHPQDYLTVAMESDCLCTSFNRNWLLKTKAQEISAYLDGRSIFLVGMMGSGKTTVGKILAEALGYSFVDSDNYLEQSFGGTPVSRIFYEYGEHFFRDNESEALRKLSLMPQQVVATGGGAVVRPVNWEYMKQGITVYLDVPLDSLARRIAAVGTNSRPLLDFDSGDAYTKAFLGLFTLSKKRAESYSSADARVSLLDLAANLDLEDISDVTPTDIAIEVLVQVEKFLGGCNSVSVQMFP